MRFDNDDALDAALFALPLEEPPADLRAAILTATIYRPIPLFSFNELAVLGVSTAIALWLAILVVMGGGTLFVHSLQAMCAAVGTALGTSSTLAWIAAGGATAIWLSIFTGFQPRAEVKAPRHR
jgi:hypothetical protein